MAWFVQQDVEPAALSAAVSHFLNCLLSSSPCFLDSCSDELASRRRSRRRRSHRGRVSSLKDSMWTKLTPSELWNRIRTEAQEYFHYEINRCAGWGCLGVVCWILQSSSAFSESIEEVIEKHGLQRTSLLREIATKTGIQVRNQACCCHIWVWNIKILLNATVVFRAFPLPAGTAEGVHVWLPTQADLWWGRCHQHVPCGQTSHIYRNRSHWAGAPCTGCNSPRWGTITVVTLHTASLYGMVVWISEVNFKVYVTLIIYFIVLAFSRGFI